MAADTTKSLTTSATTFLEAYPAGTFLGVVPLFTGVHVVPAGATDWIILPSGDDPQIKLGSMHAPRSAKQALVKLARSKAPVAALYIAHEVPKGAEQRLERRSLAEELRTDPAERNKLLAARLDKVGRAVTGAVTGFAALAAAPVLALGVLANLDPAVLAAVTASGTARTGELAAFFHVVSWT